MGSAPWHDQTDFARIFILMTARRDTSWDLRLDLRSARRIKKRVAFLYRHELPPHEKTTATPGRDMCHQGSIRS